MRDPYEVIGVAKPSSQDDIKKAYRKLARRLHPDLHPGDKQAEAQFKEVSAAYDLISDPKKRAAYDAGEIDASGNPRPERTFYRSYADGRRGAKYRDAGSVFGSGMDADDILSELFRHAAQGQHERHQSERSPDMRYRLEIDFLDAARGVTKEVNLPDGRRLRVAIPPGAEDGQVLRLKGQGIPGVRAGQPGDALIELQVRPHPFFKRKGRDISVEISVTVPEAILGGKVDIPTIAGDVSMTIPAGSNAGTVLRLKGKGIPDPKGTPGDQFVTLRVVLPEQPDSELTEAIAKWVKTHPQTIRNRTGGSA
ncbi:MAG: J domain-containing protein [Rhodospirillales bacterium]|nr:J domain-containing protein [Rhodospirillales bacterium]